MDVCYLVLPLTRSFAGKNHEYNRRLKNRTVSINHINQYAIKSLLQGLNSRDWCLPFDRTTSGSLSLTTFRTVVRVVFKPVLVRICNIFQYPRQAVHENQEQWSANNIKPNFT